jgi:hypothetical protein
VCSFWPFEYTVIIIAVLSSVSARTEDHDAKGQIRQLLTSEHIDEEISDLNRKISEAIQFVHVRDVMGGQQKAVLI